MNRGLLLKSFIDARAVTLLLAVAMLLAEGVLSYVLPTVMQDFSSTLLQVPFFRTIISALLGADIGETLLPATFIAIAWVHPVVLAILWTHAIVMGTRVPAGEIDRGTIDLLLSLPVSRWQVYIAETVVFLATGLAVVAMGMVEGIRHRRSDPNGFIHRKLLLAVDTVLKGLSLQIGHHIEEEAVGFSGIEEWQDMRMLQVGSRLDLG